MLSSIFYVSRSLFLQWAFAVFLLAEISGGKGHITIKQTKVIQNSDTEILEFPWLVDGVASMELNPDANTWYWVDCSADQSSDRLRWERVGGLEFPFEVVRLPMGKRLNVGRAWLFQENLGQYRCYHNDTGESSTVLLTSESPAIVPVRETVLAAVNQTVSLLVHFSTFDGPTAVHRVTWTLPTGETLTNETDARIETGHTWSRLTLDRVTSQSPGRYNCTVTEINTLNTASTSINLTLFVPASIVDPPSPVSVKEGHNATFSCRATGSPRPNITWERVGTSSYSRQELTHTQHIVIQETILQDDTQGMGTVSSRMVLVDVGTEDAGVYYCLAQNTLHQLQHREEINTTLSVDPQGSPQVKLVYNNVSNTSHSVVLLSSSGAKPRFRCLVEGDPSPSISWSISHSQSTPATIRYTYVLTQSEQSLLWEAPVETSDSGLYECVVRNGFGEGRASVDLTVTHKPVIDGIIPSSGLDFLSTAKNSKNLFQVPVNFQGTVLTCVGYGWPVPRVEWTSIKDDDADGGELLCGMESHYVSQGDGIATAHLVLVDTQFNSSCVGRVQCSVTVDLLDDRVSHSVVLMQGSTSDEASDGDSTEFQLKIELPHSQSCSEWTQKNSVDLQANLGQILTRILTNSADERQDCINISTLTCSKDCVLVRGILHQDCQISAPGRVTTTTMLYSFLQWKNSGPLISLNGTLCKVDPEFPHSPATCRELCMESSSEATSCYMREISIGLYTACGVVIVLFIVLVVVLFHQCRHFLSRSCCHPPRHCHEKRSEPNHYV